MLRFAIPAMCLALAWPLAGGAQTDPGTLADIRQELTVLNVEVQRLRRELSTTGAPGTNVSGGTTLDRLNAIEAELQRLTGKTEQLEFRIGRVVEDGTNRIGDLEFRLVELEGGDVATLGDTPTLGGATGTPAPELAPTAQLDTQLATQEEADFKRASEALASGDFRSAAEQFATFNQTYPGGPLAAAADLARGDALEKMGDIREASLAYLASFSTDQNGASAPEALFRLGSGLGELGKIDEACVTLGEVPVRFDGTDAAALARTRMQDIGCP